MASVVHLTGVHRPFDTRIFHKECKTLAQAGYEVILVAPLDREVVVGGVRVRPLSKTNTRLARMTLTAYRVYRAALEEDADIYHVHDPELLLCAQLLRMRGKRVIYDMHESPPKQILTKPWIPRLLRGAVARVYRLCEPALMRGLPVVFAEYSYHSDYEWVRRYVVVLNMPIPDRLLGMREPKHDAHTIGYIGGVAPARGSTITLEALRILKRRGREVHFECVGPASETHKTQLERLVNAYGLDGIRFRGYMLPDNGWRLISCCHIGVALLKPTPNYVESYPTKMFEYMAMGLPVIVSDFPLYREVVEGARCGLCVDPVEPQDVADAIEWLLDHPEEAWAMGRRGREAVRTQYNWDIEAEKLLRFYAEVLRPR